MTFKKFAEITAAHRPDAVVHAHKAFGGVHDVAVYFKRQDGKESKVYSYRGSYAAILGKLGVKVVTSEAMAEAKAELAHYVEKNGRANLFTGKAMDYSAEIARLTAQIAAYNSDEYVRDWE